MKYTYEIVATTPDTGLYDAIYQVQGKHPRDSRNGPTLEFPGVATVVYPNPLQRVLFDENRDCNHFFSLYEALWMLGGREDLASITYFNSKFGQYSDDGKLIRGSAYGVRWRSWFGHDQLEAAKWRFESEGSATRRVVIMQWDAVTDPVVDSKDVPCNTQCCLLMREGEGGTPTLDLTVFNRSNDIVYGTFGSNVVHFSMFLEYMAKMLNLDVGVYFQTSNCLHAYTEFPIYKKIAPGILEGQLERSDYETGRASPSPMFRPDESIEEFDADCKRLLDSHANGLIEATPEGLPDLDTQNYSTAFFRDVVLPMMRAWKLWKETKDPHSAAELLRTAVDEESPQDWLVAGIEWMERRIK